MRLNVQKRALRARRGQALCPPSSPFTSSSTWHHLSCRNPLPNPCSSITNLTMPSLPKTIGFEVNTLAMAASVEDLLSRSIFRSYISTEQALFQRGKYFMCLHDVSYCCRFGPASDPVVSALLHWDHPSPAYTRIEDSFDLVMSL